MVFGRAVDLDPLRGPALLAAAASFHKHLAPVCACPRRAVQAVNVAVVVLAARGAAAYPIRPGWGRGTGAARPPVRGPGARKPWRGSRRRTAGRWVSRGRAKSPLVWRSVEGTKALLVEAADETAGRGPGRCNAPGRQSRGRSAFGRVHGRKALVRGMQRGAKLPPCQDERAVRRAAARDPRAHLASAVKRLFSPPPIPGT